MQNAKYSWWAGDTFENVPSCFFSLRQMVPSSVVRCILLLLGLVWKGTSASYSCICSYQENSEIFEKPDTSSSVDGYMKKSECKPFYNVTGLDKQFVAIGNEGKVCIDINTPSQFQPVCYCDGRQSMLS